MFCSNCGKQLDDGSKFCLHCGAPQEPTSTVKNKKEKKTTDKKGTEKSKKTGAIIGIGAAVVAGIVIVALLVSGIFSNPQVKLGKAILKSTAAHQSVYDDLIATDFAAMAASEKMSEKYFITVDEIYGDSEYSGIGFRVENNVDLPGQKIDFTMVPFRNGSDIASIQMGLHGTKLFVGSPEVTDGVFYGIDTATLGHDIEVFSGDDYLGDLSFNVYDLINSLKELQDREALKANIEAATKTLIESMEVTKDDKETTTVNDNNVEAVKYHALIPADAVETYIYALEGAFDSNQMIDNMDAIIESLGLSEDAEDELKYAYEDFDLDYLFDELEDIADELDTIEVDAYVANGYLVAVEYEDNAYDEEFSFRAELGGGKNYVDDISFIYELDDVGEIIISSSGDHSGDIFTDETVLIYNEYDYEKETLFSMETEYNKKDLSFRSEIDIYDEYSVVCEGTLDTNESTFDLQLTSLEIEDWDDSVFEGTFGYTLSSYESSAMEVAEIINILTMTEDEAIETGEEVYDNIVEIVEDLDLDIDLADNLFEDEDAYWDAYSLGYDDGYDAGWFGWGYDLSGSYMYSGDRYEGYIDGYDCGYDDGWYGFGYRFNYGF